MKPFNFLVVLSFILILSSGYATGQKKNDSTMTDSLMNSSKLSKIEEKLNEKYYTRIPNQDFENIVNGKIDEKVSSKFYFWFGLIIGFITLSGAGLYSLINNQIDSKVKKASEELTKYIDEAMNKKFADINAFIIEAKRTIFNDELEKLQKRISNNTTHNSTEYEKIEDKLNALLQRTEEIGETELSTVIIDELVRCYYINRNNTEISQIIQRYQDKVDLTMTTLANAAIAYANLYELDGAAAYKEMTLKYCQEAFKKNPVYGEPTTMELMICMMDYLRAANETEKQNAYGNAQEIIDKVNSGSSYLWAFQTIKRLDIDKAFIFEKYVDQLTVLFPDKMKEMRTKSEDYEAKKHI